MTLSILCVTRGDDYAHPFLNEMNDLAWDLEAVLVVAADGEAAYQRLDWLGHGVVRPVNSGGYIESVLDEALTFCPDGYVLRLDDDERVSPQMHDWLLAYAYEAHDHWAFPRLNLYPDAGSYATSHGLYPDLQTRLSLRAKAGDRRRVHQGSPYGAGVVAPCPIEHHKFLVRDIDSRRALLDWYEQIQPGAGSRFVQFSVPEDLPVETAAVDQLVMS